MKKEKIVYCLDNRLKKKFPLPLSVITTSQIKRAYKEDITAVIFQENFFKKKKLIDFSKLSDKACFIYFQKGRKSNLELVRKFKFSNGIIFGESKSQIRLKLSRAEEILTLKRRISALNEEVLKKDEEIEKTAQIDPLTACYNWRYFLSRAPVELIRAHRHIHSLSFMAVDIDYFRQVNEIYGAKIADKIIKDMVGVIKKCLRKEDVLCRWREDSFFIILPYLEKKDIPKVAQRIKNKVTSWQFRCQKITLKIKISIGTVTFPEDKVFNIRDIISALDSGLTAAKRKGGNTIAIYSQVQEDFPHPREDRLNIGELKQKIDKLSTVLDRDVIDMIYGFARAIEAKDHYTGKHVELTAAISEGLAKELKLPPSEIKNVKQAAILHDLGKVGIDGAILAKCGPLNEKERTAIMCHPWIAAEILREVHSLRGAIPAILYHHERYDGKGYPLGLKGEEIPLNARIVALSDVYQALISDRPYRKAFSKKKAIKIIRNAAGIQFDPKVVKAFLKVIDKKIE